MAAHRNGGLVIVQVERVVEANTIPCRMVHIPGVLVNQVLTAAFVCEAKSSHPIVESPAFLLQTIFPLSTSNAASLKQAMQGFMAFVGIDVGADWLDPWM